MTTETKPSDVIQIPRKAVFSGSLSKFANTNTQVRKLCVNTAAGAALRSAKLAARREHIWSGEHFPGK